MQRRDFLKDSAKVGGLIGATRLGAVLDQESFASRLLILPNENKLTPPAKGKIPVAVLISNQVTMMDYAGPWEVFQDVDIPSRGEGEDRMPFQLFTVSDTTEVVLGTAGLKIVPNYTFQTAPTPKVI